MPIAWLRAVAPFAAYRPMQAGSLRATLPVMTYTAAWGLVLNLAGIETRQGRDRAVTGIDPGAPRLSLAIGLAGADPIVGSLFQQGHGYPVGGSGKELQALTKGCKYWIAPVRRELLSGLDVQIGIDAEGQLLERVRRGLHGQGDWPRYGLPFAGDNNLLFDRLEMLPKPHPTRWYLPIPPRSKPLRGATRLTTGIDRWDSSRTEVAHVAPMETAVDVPPKAAWVTVPSLASAA